MSYQLKRTLALTLSFVLCMSCIPTNVLAEDWEHVQQTIVEEQPNNAESKNEGKTVSQDATEPTISNEDDKSNQDSHNTESPKVQYRTHAQNDVIKSSEDNAWIDALSSLHDDEAKGLSSSTTNTPIDELEIKTTFETGTVEYRLLDGDVTWQETWSSSGETARIESGVYGVQARLSDDLAADYDLWYRSRTVDGTWLGWTHAGQASGSANTPLAEVQFALCAASDNALIDESIASNDSPTVVAFEEATVADNPTSATDKSAANAEDVAANAVDATANGDVVSNDAPEANGDALGTDSDDETATDEAPASGQASEAATEASEGPEASEAATEANEAPEASEASEAAEASGAAAEGNHASTNEASGVEASTKAKAPSKTAPKATTKDKTAQTQTSKQASNAKANEKTNEGGISAMADPSIEYQTHVQNYGWQTWVQNGKMAGTSGESKRLEAMRIRLKNASGSVVYQTHAQTYGWLNEVSNGELSGTSGESKRLESIKIHLTGDIAKTHDVWYRCHVQTYGWQGWVKNGALAGTSGQSKRVEALEIRLVKKGATTPSPVMTPGVEYQTHVQTYGWQSWVSNGSTAGTSGESKRLEAMRIRLLGVDGGVTYRTHVQTYGWQDWRSNGDLSGTSGESKRLEAIQISLTGGAEDSYDIWYRCHVQRRGWMGWAKNGANAGTEGGGLRMEALQIKLLPKGSMAPGSTNAPYAVIEADTLNGVDISGWDQGIDISDTEGDFIIIKATEGVSTPGSPATRYNPWYKQWANEVLAEGRLLGFYHYANGGDAVAEADEFYEAIKDYKGRAIACLDWEGDGNKLFDTGMDVAWCKRFLDRLQSRMGGIPFLYTSKSYCNAYNWSSVAASYPLWGAEYASMEPVYGYQKNPWSSSSPWGAWGAKPTIHQYAGTGVLEHNGGIDYFDVNLFYGNRADWNRYVG